MHKSRKIKNFIINSSFQLHFSTYFILSAACLQAVIIYIFYFKIQSISQVLSQSSDLDASLVLYQSFYELIWLLLIAFIAYSFFIFIISFILSHRIAGPAHAICLYIDELKKGNYDAKRTLRKGDELNMIMDSLQDLSRQLQNKPKQ